ncbi:GNAT family N-acetyltransferase [Micromonospora endophytica]|uniref:GNAT family N-acetyltransferase n=2 Tax=Micromonospora endophytica TaxID=515350 RepID=A0A2W2CK87_9ACTN|nr:GNAT family N-acetyltransferase [Micromonospora endophytica]RIW40977.1 GNAT family N-acetyltransferase [Micromonospora endophytica]
MLRALRRQADLSQRELASLSGVPQSTVARIESGQAADPRFQTVQRLVRAAGGALRLGTVAGSDAGSELGCPGRACRGRDPLGDAAIPDDTRRDEAGRRYPAHLDVRKVRTLKDWPGAWWAHSYTLPFERWPLRVPKVTYDLDRGRRDERRLRERLRDAVEIRRITEGVPSGCWRLVAELPDGDLVGELRAHERSLDLRYGEEMGDRREVVLDGVLVAPRLRLLGIGRRLVDRLAAETRDAGLTAVCALAELDGIPFLLACGYRIEWSRPQALRLEW